MRGGSRTLRWSLVGLVGFGCTLVGPTGVRPATGAPQDRPRHASVQGSVCLSDTSPDDLSRLFDGEPGGLLGADYQRAHELGDGRVLWLFQDGAVRTSPDRIVVVHNVAMLQDGTCFDVLYGGSRSAPEPFLFAELTRPFARWFWPLGAELGDDGSLYVFVAEMVERGDAYLTRVEPVGTRVAIVAPTLDAVVEDDVPGNPSASLYGWSVTSDTTWTYLYAQCYRQFGYDIYVFSAAFDRECSPIVTVGRVPRGDLLAVPEYWDGDRWQDDPARAAPVIRTDGRRVNANQIAFNGSSFFSVNKEGDWWGDTIVFARAERATGPFVAYDTVVAPVKCAVCNSFFATWIPRAAVRHAPGTFVFGLSHNRWDGAVSSGYRPTFHEVPAPPQLAGGDTLPISAGRDATAVLINVTSTRSEERGHVIAHPCDRPRPLTSSLNHDVGVTTGNLAVVRPDADGRVCLFSRSTTDLVVDSFGAVGSGDGFVPVDASVRLVDTRDTRVLDAGEVLRVRPGAAFDSIDVVAVVVNLTSVSPDAPGYVTAYPCDRDRPVAANVNHRPGSVVGNLAMVGVGATGEVCIYTRSRTDLVVDLAGVFVAGGVFTPEATPTRLVDTRTLGDPVAAGGVLRVSVPGDSHGAVVMNVASVAAGDRGYVTAFPCDEERPTVASLSYSAGEVRSNLVVARSGESGEVCLFTRSSTHLVVDLAGRLATIDGRVIADHPIRVADTRLGIDR